MKETELQPLALIVCYAKNRVIGNKGDIPWHEPADLAHFKNHTVGHAIIQGRKSHESIGKPLPGRRNIVISRDPAYTAEGCETATNLPDAIDLARETDELPFICGGTAIYGEAIPLCTKLYLTEIDLEPEGDATFPAFDESEWTETERRVEGRCVYRTLERKVS